MLNAQLFHLFAVLADTGDLCIAAQYLKTSPQQLKSHLKALEAFSGTRLFTEQYTLTAAGVWFKDKNYGLLQSFQKLSEDQLQQKQTLNLGWSGFWGECYIHQWPPFLSMLDKSLHLQKYNRFPTHLMHAFDIGSLDLMITTYKISGSPVILEPPRREHRLFLTPVFPFQIVSRPQNPVHDWQNLYFATLPPSRQEKIPLIWDERQYPRKISHIYPSFQGIKLLCQYADIAGFLPQILTHEEQKKGLLHIQASPPKEASVQGVLVCQPDFPAPFFKQLEEIGFMEQ